MSTTRTFIAIPADDEVYAKALSTIEALRPLTDNVRWVVPDSLHWTLQFLGDVEDETLYEICRDVARVCEATDAFDLGAIAVSAFPNIEKPRTIWLGAGEGSEALCKLQDGIEERMAKLGFRPERRQFTPHLTIGRVHQGSHAGAALSEQLATLAEFDGGRMEVNEVIVYGSELSREGPTYHVIGRAPLVGVG